MISSDSIFNSTTKLRKNLGRAKKRKVSMEEMDNWIKSADGTLKDVKALLDEPIDDVTMSMKLLHNLIQLTFIAGQLRFQKYVFETKRLQKRKRYVFSCYIQ